MQLAYGNSYDLFQLWTKISADCQFQQSIVGSNSRLSVPTVDCRFQQSIVGSNSRLSVPTVDCRCEQSIADVNGRNLNSRWLMCLCE